MKKKLQTTLSGRTKTNTTSVPNKPAKPRGQIIVRKEMPVQIWFQFGIPQDTAKAFTVSKPSLGTSATKKETAKDSFKSDTSGSSEEPTIGEDLGAFPKDFILDQVILILTELGDYRWCNYT